MEYQVSLTQDECDFIHALLYNAVGGSPRGPRRIGESICEKLPHVNRNRFKVAFVQGTAMGHPTGKYRVELRDNKEPA